MTKLFWQSLLAVPAAFGAALALSGAAVAAQSAPVEAISSEAAPVSVTSLEQEPVQLAQITSVSQLSDVLPSDWAYQALQSLVEQYGCIQGYPDRTFRGNSPMTRYEFAAGLNSCLDVIAQLIAQGQGDDSDLATIRRLQEEFQAELNTLRGRVDALEADVAELEANQFSTTTKLRGQVDFHLATPFDTLNTGALSGIAPETSTSFNSRARLNFDTSFTGEDRLRVRLQASSGSQPLDPWGGLANASGFGDSPMDLRVDDFYYQFPVGERIDVKLAANSLDSDEYLRDILPFGNSVADAGSPKYLDIAGSGTGVAVSFAFTDSLVFDAGYSANTAGSASPSIGVFQASSQGYGASLSFIPESFLNVSLTYLHSDLGPSFNALGLAGATDTYGAQVALDFGGFEIGGAGGYTTFSGGNTFSWLGGIAFNDLFVEGGQLGVYATQIPSRNSGANPFLLEGYYNIPFNEFLTITDRKSVV